jgi:hypothetical protein
MENNGLTTGNCKHERQEYWHLADGMEWWVCLDCSEKLHRYIDTIGG